MTDFDLHALVRSVTETSGLLGPREIAAKVAENVPRAKLRDALAAALVPFVREDLTRLRATAPIGPRPSAPSNRNSARSPKVRAVREAWRKVLAGQVHVGHGQWQVLADCSYDNVVFLANERHEVARRTAASGDRFERLASAMKKHKVSRVSELPESVLAEILSDEAAAA